MWRVGCSPLVQRQAGTARQQDVQVGVPRRWLVARYVRLRRAYPSQFPPTFVRYLGYWRSSGWVSPVWPIVILYLGPRDSPCGSPKQVHARDGVDRASTTRGRRGASLAHVTVTCGHLDHVMVSCDQLHHVTGGWGCCHLHDRPPFGPSTDAIPGKLDGRSY